MRNDHLRRQWDLLLTLCASAGCSQSDLATQFHCSVRTIQRDLEPLMDLAFPVERELRGHQTFWHIPPSFRKFSLPLTLPELTALAAASNFYQ